jgi:hypothetical protein
MSNYPLLVASAVATFAMNVVHEVFVGTDAEAENAGDKPRPVGDILDVRGSFVPGYPQHIEGEHA